MKKHILFTALILLLGVFGTVQAQSLTNIEIENAIRKDGRYAIQAQSSRHFMGAVMSGAAIKKDYPSVQFVVGMAGPVVKELAEDKSLKEIIEIAKENGIRLVVCESAMNRLDVKKTDYHSYIQTTPNVYRFMFGIQEIGFKILSL